MSLLMSVGGVERRCLQTRGVIGSPPGLLSPVGFSCIFFNSDTLVTGLQYKAALRRGYSSSYLTILAHGGTRGQEAGASSEAAYQKDP